MAALLFDPFAALAEIQNHRGLPAKAAYPAKVTPQPVPSLAALAGLAGVPLEIEKMEAPKWTGPAAWNTALAGLDASRAPGGFDPQRWRIVLADARWLARVHGETAAALGWTASDLFGLDPLPGWGGLADHLDGARTLALTATLAHWRSDEAQGWLWRRTLSPKPLLWEA